MLPSYPCNHVFQIGSLSRPSAPISSEHGKRFKEPLSWCCAEMYASDHATSLGRAPARRIHARCAPHSSLFLCGPALVRAFTISGRSYSRAIRSWTTRSRTASRPVRVQPKRRQRVASECFELSISVPLASGRLAERAGLRQD